MYSRRDVLSDRWTDGWLDGLMDGRTDSWMDGLLDWQADGWTARLMIGWMDGLPVKCFNRGTNGRIYSWTDWQTDGCNGRTDGRTDRCTDLLWLYRLFLHYLVINTLCQMVCPSTTACKPVHNVPQKQMKNKNWNLPNACFVANDVLWISLSSVLWSFSVLWLLTSSSSSSASSSSFRSKDKAIFCLREACRSLFELSKAFLRCASPLAMAICLSRSFTISSCLALISTKVTKPWTMQVYNI